MTSGTLSTDAVKVPFKLTVEGEMVIVLGVAGAPIQFLTVTALVLARDVLLPQSLLATTEIVPIA